MRISKREKPMRLMMNLLIIMIGGGVLFVAACVLEVIISGVLGFVLIQDTGIGVPFRFFALGLGLLSSGYFSAGKLLLDWLVWCLVFAPLFYAVRALIRWYR